MNVPHENVGVYPSTGRLDVDEVTALMESVSGARNIALLAALDESRIFYPQEIEELYDDALASQGDPRTPQGEAISLPPGARHQLKHASSMLITSMGEERGSRWEPKGYSPTEFAIERCRPLAGHICRIARKNDIAPTDLTGYRSPPQTTDGFEQTMSRLSLYGTMLQAARNQTEFWGISTLADETELSAAVIHNHIDPMVRANIVRPVYSTKRTSYPTYEIAEYAATVSEDTLEEALSATGWNNKKRDLTRWVVGQASTGALTDMRVKQVWEAILQENDYSERFFTTKKPSRQRAAVNQALELLTQIGFLIADDSDVRQQLSGIALSETGRNILEDYITTIGNIILNNSQVVANGTRIADEVARDRQAMGWLLTVDQCKGAIAAHENLKKKEFTLRALLANGALSTPKICEQTKWKNRAANDTLSKLEEQGVVTSYAEGRDIYWQLREAQETPEQ